MKFIALIGLFLIATTPLIGEELGILTLEAAQGEMGARSEARENLIEAWNDTGTPGQQLAYGSTFYAWEYSPTTTYTLNRIEFYAGILGGTVTMEILADNLSGYPDGPVLSSVTYEESEVRGWQGANLQPPVTLNAGARYYIRYTPVPNAWWSASSTIGGDYYPYFYYQEQWNWYSPGTRLMARFYGDTSAPTIPVTFTVIDGTQSFEAIEFKGTPTDWATIPMNDSDGDHTWEVTVDVSPGDHEWGAIENDGSEWGIWLIEGDNLAFSVDAEGNVSGTVSYSIPVPPPLLDVTFFLDMSNETVSEDGVHLAGGFGANGYPEWNPNSTPLTDGNGDNIYSVTLTLSQETTYEFKFINGVIWDAQEQVPSECGVDDQNGGYNRAITTPAASAPFSVGYVFGSCEVLTGVGDQESVAMPSSTQWLRNYPNPFNPATQINFAIDKAQTVDLKVYDISGRMVQQLAQSRPLNAGTHTINWNAKGLPSGTYVYSLVFEDGTVLTEKAILLK